MLQMKFKFNNPQSLQRQENNKKKQLNNLKLLKLRNENCFCGMHEILSGQPKSMQQMRVRVQQAAVAASAFASAFASAAACNGCAMA